MNITTNPSSIYSDALVFNLSHNRVEFQFSYLGEACSNHVDHVCGLVKRCRAAMCVCNRQE